MGRENSRINRTANLAGFWLAILFLLFAGKAHSQATVQPTSRCWTYTGESSESGSFTIDDVNVYVVEGINKLVALDRQIGMVNWTVELGGMIASPLVDNGSSILVASNVGSDDAQLKRSVIRSISKETGLTNWITDLPFAHRYSIGSINGTVAVFSENGTGFAIDGKSGAIKWKRQSAFKLPAGTVLLNNSISALSGMKRVETLSIESGQIIKRFDLTSEPVVYTLVDSETVVFADRRGTLWAVGSDNSWKYRTGGAVSFLLQAGGHILAASADNFLYAIAPGSGKVEWKRKLPGRISSVALSEEETVVITVVGVPTAFIVDAKEGRFTNQLVLEKEEEFLGQPIVGKGGFVAIRTTRGLALFSKTCGNGKSGS
jgi:hypothetical protein